MWIKQLRKLLYTFKRKINRIYLRIRYINLKFVKRKKTC